jgi:hypothetical protein
LLPCDCVDDRLQLLHLVSNELKLHIRQAENALYSAAHLAQIGAVAAKLHCFEVLC